MNDLNFPKNFTWGVATSAYQIEGAHNIDGKGPSIWDAFCEIPGRVLGDDHGQVACDHYRLYPQDVQMMADLGIRNYRFSLSWPRIIPTGKGTINKAGIRFYSDLIDELLKHDITPWVTLYHWDLPLDLQIAHDGWLNRDIASDFAAYADVCFEHFGDRVKHWITLNEPWVIAVLGYGEGVFAPGRTSIVEPYIAGHNLLLAHGQAVRLYREKFQWQQNGTIGITNNCDWREPKTDSPKNIAAADRAMEFFLAWFTDPLYLGHYPQSMRTRLGERLPKFSMEARELVQGSSDFYGLNHYATMYAEHTDPTSDPNIGLAADQGVKLSPDPEWQTTDLDWPVVPWGFQKLLEWITERYDRPEIVVTENGCAYDDPLIDGEVNDQRRIDFYHGYLQAAQSAIANGANLTGYFAWSLMDNFEWASGYSKRFGMTHVDYSTLKRTPKASALWYRDLLKAHNKR